MTGSKTCRQCGRDKPLSDYGCRNRAGDGKKGICKACDSEKSYQKRLRANPKMRPRGVQYCALIKICANCGIDKDRSEFPELARSKYCNDGLHSHCKSCRSEISRDRYHNKGGKEAQKEYNSRPEIREYRSAYSANWQKENPDIFRAETLARYHLKHGYIQKPPFCEACGRPWHTVGESEMHHDSYLVGDELKVRFLCIPCHNDWHRNNEPKRDLVNWLEVMGHTLRDSQLDLFDDSYRR